MSTGQEAIEGARADLAAAVGKAVKIKWQLEIEEARVAWIYARLSLLHLRHRSEASPSQIDSAQVAVARAKRHLDALEGNPLLLVSP